MTTQCRPTEQLFLRTIIAAGTGESNAALFGAGTFPTLVESTILSFLSYHFVLSEVQRTQVIARLSIIFITVNLAIDQTGRL